MNSDPLLTTLGSIATVLFFGTLTAMMFRAIRVSPIVGYILLGVVAKALGFEPFGETTIDTLAQLGVVFLLFDLGLHFSWRDIRQRAADIFAFGPVQILACTLIIGGIGLLFGGEPLPMFLMGAALSLSSTAVVARLIADRHQQNCPVGLTATAILVFQDVVGIILLVVIGSLTQPGTALEGISIALLKALVAAGVAALAARYVIAPFFTIVAKTRSEEVSTAAALFVALACSWATGQVGLSPTLGAFLGGMMLANTPYRMTIHSEISAFRSLLLSFFFLAVGYSLDGGFLVQAWGLVSLAALALLASKTLGNVIASLLFRWSAPGSVQLGMLLAQGSEFGLILLSTAQMRALLGEALATVMVSAIALTLALTPAAAQLGRVFAGRMRRRRSTRMDLELTPTKITAPVVIVGMGEIGRTIADALRAFEIDYFAIENDSERLKAAIADGYHVEYADSADSRYWEPVELSHRVLSVLTSADLNYLRGSAEVIAMRFPKLQRLAVVQNKQGARAVRGFGLNVVVDDKEPHGVHAASAVLRQLGRTDAEVATWRQRFCASSEHVGSFGLAALIDAEAG